MKKDSIGKFLIYWAGGLAPNITFLIVDWHYALIISNIIYGLIAYGNSRKCGYPVYKAIILPLLFNVIGAEIVTRQMNKIYKPITEDLKNNNEYFNQEKIKNFSEFKRAIESKLNSGEKIDVEFYMYKYDVIEKVETYNENWKGIDYTLSWDTFIKNAEFSFAEAITDFYEIIKDFSSLDELKGDDFDLVPIADGGGYSENFKIVWQRELSDEESKQFEKYGGVQQLRLDSDEYDNVDVIKGRISSIVVKTGNNENIKISAL